MKVYTTFRCIQLAVNYGRLILRTLPFLFLKKNFIEIQCTQFPKLNASNNLLLTFDRTDFQNLCLRVCSKRDVVSENWSEFT
jgi:hypothetical protein